MPLPGKDSSGSCVTCEINWYAVYTAARHEKRVAQHFTIRQIESYLPLYYSVHSWRNGCKAELELPLFPGYIFVHIDPQDRLRVLETPGVVSIVSCGRRPIPLPAFIIERFRCGLPQMKAEPHAFLSAGDTAVIKRGAMAGLKGVVLRKKSGLRVVLTLELISRSIAVEVNAEDIEVLSTRESAGLRQANATEWSHALA